MAMPGSCLWTSFPRTRSGQKELYEKNYEACLKNNTTEKQAMAAAIIVTADALATEWIFKDGRALTVEEISEFR